MRRYGPIAVIVVVVAVVGAIVLVSGGGDDSDDATDDTVAAEDVGEGALSFSAAEEQGIEVDWRDDCDTERGTVAIPNYFAAECYAPFEGDNGGATATGVTADTIKIVFYQSPPNPISTTSSAASASTDTNDEALATMQTYVDIFNEYYETYGRTVEVVEVEGSGPPNDDVAARADAVRVDEEIGAFTVWGGPILTDAFADELAPARSCASAARSVSPTPSRPTGRPYVITIGQLPDQGGPPRRIALQAGRRPAGRVRRARPCRARTGCSAPSSWRATRTQRRRTRSRSDMLADEGIDVAERIAYQLDPARLQEQAASAIARFKEAGVTSIIFSGDPVAPATFTTEATNQDYFPEWIITGSALTDTTASARSFDQEQWSHAFGISSLAARLNPENSGSFYLYTWYTGEEPPAADTTGVILPLPQVFFGALQEVGPELTREAWVAALLAAEPTPDAISQPSLDWGDVEGWPATDYHGIDDWTEIWWDSESEGPSEIRRVEPGIYQYVDGGRRYRLGEWPEEDSRAFDPEGAVAFYEQPPEGEEAPDYPSPAG